MAEVSFGMDFAISILAVFEAWVVCSSAYSSSKALSNNFSMDSEDERRALRCSSERDVGKSLAKCSLLRNLRNAKRDEERDMDSAMELPRNL